VCVARGDVGGDFWFAQLRYKWRWWLVGLKK